MWFAVVFLRGSELGICLGPPLLGSPLEVFRMKIVLMFGGKHIINSCNIIRSRS